MLDVYLSLGLPSVNCLEMIPISESSLAISIWDITKSDLPTHLFSLKASSVPMKVVSLDRHVLPPD